MNKLFKIFGATETVIQIFWANVIIFIVGMSLQSSGVPFYDTFSLYAPSSGKFQWFQPITHMFLHGSVIHILFNMIVFLSFGGIVENYFGRKKFIYFYFIAGLGSALLQTIIVGGNVGMIGASGAIFGVMIVSAFRQPDAKASLFFLFPIKMKYIIPGLFLIELMSGIFGWEQGTAHYAHVGGAITGAAFYLIDRIARGERYYR